MRSDSPVATAMGMVSGGGGGGGGGHILHRAAQCRAEKRGRGRQAAMGACSQRRGVRRARDMLPRHPALRHEKVACQGAHHLWRAPHGTAQVQRAAWGAQQGVRTAGKPNARVQDAPWTPGRGMCGSTS